MSHAIAKRPHEISGGMKQRVGIARALAMEPKVLLLDEPFGALDALTRAHLQDELLKIVERLRCTVVMVTHDVDEAVLLADRVLVLDGGRIVADLRIDQQRPRSAENHAFQKVRTQLLQLLGVELDADAGAPKPVLHLVPPSPAAPFNLSNFSI
jgi:sulfonate transport system ATP-binding protein